MENKRKKRVLVVSHDAGGAEVVSAYVSHYQRKYDFHCFVAGPALNVFKKRRLERYFVSGLGVETAGGVLDKIDEIDFVLTATSWSSRVELQFLDEAKKRGIYTAAYLDHWTNYRERFGYPNKQWKKNLPDEIWVGDRDALVLAKQFGFPNIKLVPNQHFLEILSKIRKLRVNRKKQESSVQIRRNILFISEPVALGAEKMFGEPRYWGFTEQEVLLMICRSAECYNLSHPSHCKIIIRPHPSDLPHSYGDVIDAYKKKVEIVYSKNRDLVTDINRADLVVGMESVALVIGLLAKKRVISIIPSAKKHCQLPFKKIIKIKDQDAIDRLLGSKNW